MQTISPTKTAELEFDETMIPAVGIAFCVEGTSRPVFSSAEKEFVMGRKVGETSGPLIDLSPFGGYHLGISRRHALIRRIGEGYEIMDLSSSNGTWLNEEQLEPNKVYPLVNGSQLRLGRMRFFVIYRSVLETRPKI
ncbi:MAG: FHA domain-containing protein [Anaerolineales bacterium]